VHWKEHSLKEDEWRPAEEVEGTQQLVATFHQINPEAPQYISSLDFTNLPFHPLPNFMDTLNMVPADWTTG